MIISLIIRFELAHLNNAELHHLYRELLIVLTQSEYGSADRRNILALLDNLTNELNERYANQWKAGLSPR